VAEPTPEPALPEPTLSEAAASEVAAPEVAEPEHVSAPPVAAAPAIEIKPDPELSAEQIKSDLGVDIAAPHETVSDVEDGEDTAPASENSSGSSPSHDYRRVAAGGE
jgi:hypothetical protein